MTYYKAYLHGYLCGEETHESGEDHSGYFSAAPDGMDEKVWAEAQNLGYYDGLDGEERRPEEELMGLISFLIPR